MSRTSHQVLAICICSTLACLAQTVNSPLERPAAVERPVWLKIPLANDIDTTYPFVLLRPAGFGCYQVEVRRNGNVLSVFANMAEQLSSSGITMAPGNPCNSVFIPSTSPARLPLHLRYRFDQPGTYEVRSLGANWIPFKIQPSSSETRAAFLAGMKAHAPTDVKALLTDFLPSILGFPDEESLRMLRPYLYHRDSRVKRYAGIALTYWPAQQAEAAGRAWIQTSGPSDAIIRYLARGQDNALPHFDWILRLSLPYLKSDSPVLVAGAIEAAYHLTGSASKVSPELRKRAVQELHDAYDHIRAIGDPQTISLMETLFR